LKEKAARDRLERCRKAGKCKRDGAGTRNDPYRYLPAAG
jgi:hypothetical protein